MAQILVVIIVKLMVMILALNIVHHYVKYLLPRAVAVLEDFTITPLVIV